ncbi:YigZ family protein [Halobellus sp. GM3]|uniref:YigZ family protein n=1 Tax=Halobellus sp. GM3 TaxID=3458410 RepID=UPI00403D8518
MPETPGNEDAPDNAPESFRTVAGPGESRFEVRGSEFIGYVAPAHDVDAAESFVERIRAHHPDATHNVPAYRVPAGGAGNSTETRGGSAAGANPGTMLREYHSDDGEPTGSAGKPALNVLAQRDVRNVVAVVTRYYGGTNLGVGGLARAYSRAVADAVDDAGVVTTVPHERFSITVEYDDSGTVRGLLESADVEFDATYEADVSFAVRAPVATAPDLRDRIRSATSGRADIERRADPGQ